MLVTIVESTTLTTIGYDHVNHLLRLEFQSRDVYYYPGVPVDVYLSLLSASSKGTYFNRYIRGRFPFHKPPDIRPALLGPTLHPELP